MSTQPSPQLSPEDYLQRETQSGVKHEYINGQIYAMAGASDAHVTLALNLATLLRPTVRQRGCRLYISDMKVRLEQRNCFYYADLFVTCDPRDRQTSLYKSFPCLVIEVLSPSTEAFDRGDKFLDYQSLETLEEYVLVNTRQQRLETFRRSTSGLWVWQGYSPPQNSVELKSIAWQGHLSDIYQDVTLEEELRS
ncbi:Uma2 family endonuclease [Thermosynechococcus sp. CL-1]|uniref:Uma2 family endonuclease n=1 Tax=unclassified Thermosynechococcus TaxID=2622553 RepID=UPI00122E6F3C|nr:MULTISPECIES: Uma2 family endonuclease [unclassified Thermosynechococcus]QEQ01239.1 Uma2 family endonuclease [Thermosynechococcus sp. CL-1]WKT82683.1 Uma2 family endonuclease [Thermosynechococcus sp. HY596]WNC61809.1 Uma2 family endonuclease [Thermosynechococcus sp. HY591]WNC64363.1 Uma2 family endonuclease [Thermosynechococcus sp. HY593]